ncbi:MAG: hypothetical protein Q8L56_03460 [Rhodocyclaceae bacterium]|nr:hypothetical protein [Rhodocyclaceae bacterium]
MSLLRCTALAWLLLAGSCAFADDATPPANEERPTPQRIGYSFEQPEILLRQRIFGLAHGVHLLVSSCLDKSEYAASTQAAYDTWYAKQHEAIATVRNALAEHHFGAAAAHTHWQDIARVLGLKETVYPSLGAVSLPEACATLPQALMQARYDFTAQLDHADDK